MHPYHKIQCPYKRDDKTHKLVPGKWREPWMGALAGIKWLLTEKIDGMNIRVKFEGGQVHVAGRSDKANIHPELLEYIALRLPPKNLAMTFSEHADVCLYGEGFGAGIQKGGNYGPDKAFILFDVMVDNLWLEWDNVQDIADSLSIEAVPLFGYGTLYDAVDWVRGGILSHIASAVPAEGIVARPVVELQDRFGQRIILKIKHKDFA